jgi:DNA-binding response OmpR family regulator
MERLLEDLEEAFGELSLAEDAGSAARVLVVDDDLRLADVTARGLRRLGFDAHASGALRALRFGEVLVVDLGVLADLDDAALESVRAARPIIVTGGTDRASRALGERVDASDYMVKPVDLADLATAVNRRKTGGE